MSYLVQRLDRASGLSATLGVRPTLPEALDLMGRLGGEGRGRDLYVRAGADDAEIADRLDALADDMRAKALLARSGDRTLTYGDVIWWRDETAKIAAALDPR